VCLPKDVKVTGPRDWKGPEMDIKDLKRAAKELEEKMMLCADLESFNIQIIPDDMAIKLIAHFKGGRIQERIFKRG